MRSCSSSVLVEQTRGVQIFRLTPVSCRFPTPLGLLPWRFRHLWVPVIRFASCDLGILMDQSTKSSPSHNPPSRQDSSRFAGPERRHLSQGAVWAVHVVVIDVRGQHSLQLPASDDQQPVQQLTTDGAHPPLRVGVGPRRPHRRGQHPDPRSGNDPVERHGEPGIPITDQKPALAEAVLKGHEQVAGLLCHPLPYWM
jgi:hypothetical protein